MAEDGISSRRALAEALQSGEVDAVFMHRETRVPEEVVEAAVEQGMPVHLVGEEEARE
ncbi:hypothetical protein [Streptomyces niveus]|uniref:hypothetical protein n=1 Tax=Streptomyces niveus TaxID=193462 RepID=UPI003418C78F